jgi:hypothetical protein
MHACIHTYIHTHIQIGADGVDKFTLVRNILSAYTNVPIPDEPAPIPKRTYETVHMRWTSSLLDNLDIIGDTPVVHGTPLIFEKLAGIGDLAGIPQMVLYSLAGVDLEDVKARLVDLDVVDVRDRAYVMVDGGMVCIYVYMCMCICMCTRTFIVRM